MYVESDVFINYLAQLRSRSFCWSKKEKKVNGVKKELLWRGLDQGLIWCFGNRLK